MVLKEGLNTLEITLTLELKTGSNMKLNCWAKSEFRADWYIIEHNTLWYKKDLAIKMVQSLEQDVYHPKHMAHG